ncbi:MAG: rhomboid family intramembrane serine protease [Bacteroidales bacterium]|nr:rhomboid family intramembrane serine protease [Bacteroidales bacterium]
MNGRRNILANIPPATKGLLIINIAMLVLTQLLAYAQVTDLNRQLGLFYFESEFFKPYQIITHMFMHGGFMHLLFNMYALWLFGQIIEKVWGSKRFLIYYFVTGLGAAALHTLVNYFQIESIISTMSPEQIEFVLQNGGKEAMKGLNWTDSQLGGYNGILNFPTVGASGAVFGILLAFGMLFPNTELQLMFIPIPIKAKYFVIGYGVLELFLGVGNFEGDNIAHYAHLGGMVFGFILIKIWGKGNSQGNNFYRQH